MTEGASGVVPSDLQALALNWRADGLGIYEGPGGAMAVVWPIDLGNPAIASQVAARLQTIADVTTGTSGSAWVTIARTSDGGPLDWAFAMNGQ